MTMGLPPSERPLHEYVRAVCERTDDTALSAMLYEFGRHEEKEAELKGI